MKVGLDSWVMSMTGQVLPPWMSGHFETCNAFVLYLPYPMICETSSNFDNFCALNLKVWNMDNMTLSKNLIQYTYCITCYKVSCIGPLSCIKTCIMYYSFLCQWKWLKNKHIEKIIKQWNDKRRNIGKQFSYVCYCFSWHHSIMRNTHSYIHIIIRVLS